MHVVKSALLVANDANKRGVYAYVSIGFEVSVLLFCIRIQLLLRSVSTYLISFV